MANGIERKMALALDAEIRGPGGFGAARLAELMDVPMRTIHNWCAGVCAPSSPDLILLVQTVQEEDPSRAARLWGHISLISGHTAQPVAVPTDNTPVLLKCLRAEAAQGELSREVASHGESTDAFEARRAIPAARAAVETDLAVLADLESKAEAGPQCPLSGVAK